MHEPFSVRIRIPKAPHFWQAHAADALLGSLHRSITNRLCVDEGPESYAPELARDCII